MRVYGKIFIEVVKMGLIANDVTKKDLIAQTFERNIDNQYFKQFRANFDDEILFPHNQNVYKKIVKGFSQGKKALFEQATGTGKSYLAIKFLKDHAQGKKVLFVSPSNVIDEYFLDTLLKTLLNLDDESIYSYSKQHKLNLIKQKLNIDFDSCLYQGLKSRAEDKYDVIIFDEAHRMGAQTWSKSVENLMENNPDALCLGMSATLDRNDGVDIKKFFNNREPVSRYSLVDALIDGVLPNPNYTLAKVDFGEDEKYIDSSIADFNEKLKTATGDERKEILSFLDQLKKAKRMIADSDDIPTIIKKKFDKPELLTGKYIVFCPAGNEKLDDDEDDVKSIHKMKFIMKQAEDWFSQVEDIKKIKKYSVYSKLGEKVNHDVIKAFENDNSKSLKLLYAINMLNEGLHVNDIDGIIMLRGTSSRIIYLQELGRVLSVGEKQNPLVLDLVANLNYVDVNGIRDIATKVNKGKAQGGNNNGTDDVNKQEVANFNLDIENYSEIEFINSLRKNIFTYNHNWFEKFIKDLLAYKNNGHPNFENLMSKDSPLKSTVGRMRERKKNGKLTDDIISRLDAIGFPWEVENNWFEEFYQDLLKYKVSHPDFKGVAGRKNPLRHRVGQIRQKKRGKGDGTILTAEMIARLDAIGFPWEGKKDWFEEFVEDLLKWKQTDPTFKNLITKKTSNCPIGNVVNAVRQSKKAFDANKTQERYELDAEKIARLDAIGFPWETVKDDTWFEEFYENLLQWKKKDPTFKNLRTHNTPDYPLGSVVSHIRMAKKAFDAGENAKYGYELDAEKIARLNAIGFPWEAIRDDSWLEKFIRDLLAWKDNGHPNFENLVSADCPIRQIVSRVRMSKKAFDAGKDPENYELDAEKIARLDAIGFPWEGKVKKKNVSVDDDGTKL